ncbi:MAG: arginine--tRNA ligase [Proteobacteria bacterium]|nr:arginine--tRNA ligase [Pseudomonadota bacterium]
MKERIRTIIARVFDACRSQGIFTGELPEFVVEVPRSREHGDLAVNVAMMLAKSEKKQPRQIAQLLVEKIEAQILQDKLPDRDSVIEKLEIAGPGFINFYLKQDAWHAILKDIEQQGPRFGSCQVGKGRRVMVEFVSANPTGPLHIGHGRGAALGDAIARVLAFAGFDVVREYYINDIGNQMQSLGRSLYLRYQQLLKKDVEFPAEGLYKGQYMLDIARDLILKQANKILDMPEDEAVGLCTQFAASTILQGIEDDLELFGVHFDSWFSEKTLFDSGAVPKALEQLKKTGLAYESEGALWFKATDFGDEKDRVMVRADGRTTYFASDIAYHRNKFERGFQRVIDIWGADHHGYVPRLSAMLKAMGLPQEAFGVILVQMVNLLRDGVPAAMSTRSGEFVTLREVIEEVGSDAARFMFLTRRSDAQLDFDLEVAKKQSDENPVYYVQYAHARICSMIAVAGEKGVACARFDDIDAGLLVEAEERELIKKLAQFPELVAGSALAAEPHRVPAYLMELVGQFHSYYAKHRVLSDNKALSAARLNLVSSIKTVLENGLALLGVTAPEKM